MLKHKWFSAVMYFIAGIVGGRMVTHKTLDLPWQLKDFSELEITLSMKTPVIRSQFGGSRGCKRLSSELIDPPEKSLTGYTIKYTDILI